MAGQYEYSWKNINTSTGPKTWPNDGTNPVNNPPGNSGTRWTNWQAGDAVANYVQSATNSLTSGESDSFTYANGDLHAANSNWAYEGSSAFTISSDVVYSTASQNPNFAYRSDFSSNSDQWAQVTAVVTGTSTQNCGVAVRISSSQQTAYIVQYWNNGLRLGKYINGTFTLLVNADTFFPVTGDKLLLVAQGTTITLYKNGTQVAQATDSSISSGLVGIFGAGSGTLNGFSAFQCGNVVETGFTPAAGSSFLAGPNGAFAPDNVSPSILLDSSQAWGQPNQYASCVINAAALLNYIGPCVNYAVSGTESGYVLLPTTSNTLIIYRFDAGVGTALSSVAYTYHQDDTFRLENQNGLLVGKVNGTVLLEAVDLTYQAGAPGIRSFRNTGTGDTSGLVVENWISGNANVIPNYPSGSSWLQAFRDFANKRGIIGG